MPEVIDVVLRYGWIDGLRHKHDDVYFRQRMTPRDDMLADGRTIHPRRPNPEGPKSEGKAR